VIAGITPFQFIVVLALRRQALPLDFLALRQDFLKPWEKRVVAPNPHSSLRETALPDRKPGPGMAPCRSASAISRRAMSHIASDWRRSRLRSGTQLSRAAAIVSVPVAEQTFVPIEMQTSAAVFAC